MIKSLFPSTQIGRSCPLKFWCRSHEEYEQTMPVVRLANRLGYNIHMVKNAGAVFSEQAWVYIPVEDQEEFFKLLSE